MLNPVDISELPPSSSRSQRQLPSSPNLKHYNLRPHGDHKLISEARAPTTAGSTPSQPRSPVCSAADLFDLHIKTLRPSKHLAASLSSSAAQAATSHRQTPPPAEVSNKLMRPRLLLSVGLKSSAALLAGTPKPQRPSSAAISIRGDLHPSQSPELPISRSPSNSAADHSY